MDIEKFVNSNIDRVKINGGEPYAILTGMDFIKHLEAEGLQFGAEPTMYNGLLVIFYTPFKKSQLMIVDKKYLTDRGLLIQTPSAKGENMKETYEQALKRNMKDPAFRKAFKEAERDFSKNYPPLHRPKKKKK